MGIKKGLYRSGIGIIFFLSFFTSVWAAHAGDRGDNHKG
jgi:hypothetical protein